MKGKGILIAEVFLETALKEKFPCPISVVTSDYKYMSAIYHIANNDVRVEFGFFHKGYIHRSVNLILLWLQRLYSYFM